MNITIPFHKLHEYQAKDIEELKLIIRGILKVRNPEGYVSSEMIKKTKGGKNNG